MNTRQLLFGHTVKAVCKEPSFYTFNGTFGEVIALLEYYANGAQIFNHIGHHGLDPFNRWLAKNQPQFEKTVDFVGWLHFWQYYQNDEKAISDFANYYAEFEKTLTDDEEVDVRFLEDEIQTLYAVLSNVLDSLETNKEQAKELECVKNKIEKQWENHISRKKYFRQELEK